ncbi:MAG: Caspase domain-containing protein, partial [Cyanobacteria bacterium J06607_10]
MGRFTESRFKAKERSLTKLCISLSALSLVSCGAVQSAWESAAFEPIDEFITTADTALQKALGRQDVRSFSLIGLDLPNNVDTYFGVFAGGGAPSYNEIALEKNVLYFQRSLEEMGLSSEAASLFFASGNFLEATIRYIDESGTEQFKRTEIQNLDGGNTIDNIYRWFVSLAATEKPCPAFFYFTGHGALNPENEDDN